MRGTQRSFNRRAALASLALLAVLAACAPPPLTPPPLPQPSTSGPNPDLAPQAGVAAYSDAGPYAVGVTTVDIEPNRRAEIWYPAAPSSAAGHTKETYYIKDFLSPFMQALLPADVNPPFLTDAYRGLPISGDGPFPLVLFSHGASGYRLQSTFLTTHLASWGFVVISPDYFERGLQSLLGSSPAPGRTDDDVANLAVNAAIAANDAGPLAGSIDTSRVFPVGHSAGGGTSTRIAGSRTDVMSWISLAGGVRPTASPIPDALNDPAKSVLWMGGANDGVAQPQSMQDAFDYTAGPRKLVFIPGAGHNNAFTDICEIARDQGGVIGLAIRAGLPVPDALIGLGQDGCNAPNTNSFDVWPITRHFVTAELRFEAGIDAQPVGLGASVLDKFGATTPTYQHNP